MPLHSYERIGRRKALHSLLHTMLHTYLLLLGILRHGPPSLVAEQAAHHRTQDQMQTLSDAVPGTEADAAISHIRTTAVNIHHICNEWRPVQARQILKQIMRAQIDGRKKRITEMQE